MKDYFLELVKIITSAIAGQENFTAWFSGEELDFARFNQGKIRQAGTVNQHYLDLDLISDKKHASVTIGLSGSHVSDREVLITEIKKLRDQIKKSHNDPFLMIHEANHSTDTIIKSELIDKTAIVSSILQQSAGLDLVGYYFGGPIYKGFANSFGQVNWFEKSSFVIDTSIYHSQDKAIKQSYADTRFNSEIFGQKIETAKLGLTLFDKEALTITPGQYRVYFSPSAVYEIISMINWGGFSRKSLEVRTSPLLPLHNQEKMFSKDFFLSENIKNGVGPNFQSQGFMKKDYVSIIEKGRLINLLISPKTAKEYQLDHNGADESETMCSIDMKAGNLLDHDILQALDNGLYINNL